MVVVIILKKQIAEGLIAKPLKTKLLLFVTGAEGDAKTIFCA